MEIVLVEDNAADAELILRALAKVESSASVSHIEHIRDGLEALAYLFKEPMADTSSTHRLILLDLKLPGMGGIQILRRLKGDRRTKRVPVVVLTSSEEERDKVESYDLGVNMYLRKPVDAGSMSDMVVYAESYWASEASQPD